VSTAAPAPLLRDLGSIVGADAVLPDSTATYLRDATEARGLGGHAVAVVLPATSADVAAVFGWCYAHDVPVVPRGGGTGFAGGCVPFGGVVLATDRLTTVRAFDPLLWRMEVEAGVRTADVRRLARENGLLFPPDPGAAEQSHIGGNVATNAEGPMRSSTASPAHGRRVSRVVVAPGEVIAVGGAARKDVAGLDLKSLLVGSEGTLGVITAVWLRLIPAPESALPVAAFYPDTASGCEAITATMGSGITASALEYLDDGALAAARRSYPGSVPEAARFLVVAEADGSRDEAERLRTELVEALGEGALAVETPEPASLWRWRDGVSIAVTTLRGGKVSEDIAVPVDRLEEAIEATVEVGRRHGLESLSWGHTGDGNLHSTFLLTRENVEEVAAAEHAAAELFVLAVRLGGTASGEHGLGVVKRGHAHWEPRIEALQQEIKQVFDPKGLLNPGKKL
jgi:FAD/FMN-containing dehydrogenase